MSRPVTDSPWFWLYSFATVGLVLMVVAGPRWLERQTRLEKRAAGYRRALSNEATKPFEPSDDPIDDATEVDDPFRESSLARFRTVTGMVAAVLVVGWIVFLWSRRGGSAMADQEGSGSVAAKENCQEVEVERGSEQREST